MYADKVKLDVQSLTFCFDGDKIDASASPTSLGMEDEDIIEVHGRKNWWRYCILVVIYTGMSVCY